MLAAPVNSACTTDTLHVTLADGRALAAPLWWYPRLLAANPSQRSDVTFSALGLHWAAIDEDISIASILKGAKAPGAMPPRRAGNAEVQS